MMRSLVAAALFLLGLHAACAADASQANPSPQSSAAKAEGVKAVQAEAPVASSDAATGVNQAPASNASAVGSDQASQRAQPSVASAAGPKRANDRLDLDATIVTGNRELPKVLYIVPWKKAELGDLPSQPFNTLLDEALTPVDRDVFRREVTYYGAVSAGANSGAATAAPQSAGPEK